MTDIPLFRAKCDCGQSSPRFGLRSPATQWAEEHRKEGHTVTVSPGGSGDPWSPL